MSSVSDVMPSLTYPVHENRPQAWSTRRHTSWRRTTRRRGGSSCTAPANNAAFQSHAEAGWASAPLLQHHNERRHPRHSMGSLNPWLQIFFLLLTVLLLLLLHTRWSFTAAVDSTIDIFGMKTGKSRSSPRSEENKVRDMSLGNSFGTSNSGSGDNGLAGCV